MDRILKQIRNCGLDFTQCRLQDTNWSFDSALSPLSLSGELSPSFGLNLDWLTFFRNVGHYYLYSGISLASITFYTLDFTQHFCSTDTKEAVLDTVYLILCLSLHHFCPKAEPTIKMYPFSKQVCLSNLKVVALCRYVSFVVTASKHQLKATLLCVSWGIVSM